MSATRASIPSVTPASPPPPETDGVPRLEWVDVTALGTSLAELRGGRRPRGAREPALGPLPLRVVPVKDGAYELIDGFKRLAHWRRLGLERVPVVVEAPRSEVEQMVALLEANRPPRTLSPMDEARVVWSLRHEQKLGPKTIAHACGQKLGWVHLRLTLAEQLCEPLQRKVDEGALGVTLAHELCALGAEDQQAVAGAVERHRLTSREAQALLGSYRLLESPAERRQLLEAPFGVVRPETRSASPLGALATRLEARLDRARAALVDLADFQLPEQDLSPAERRRLEADYQGALLTLIHTARSLAIEHLGFSPTKEAKDDHTEQDPQPSRPTPGADFDAEGRAFAADASDRGDDAAPGAGARAGGWGPAATGAAGGAGAHAGAAASRQAQPTPDEGDRAATQDEARHAQDRPEGRRGPQGGPQPA
ncbi:MAG: ParB N-terminal domain-containing protein, partial [Polyangiaceae bacterium]|nr:ParB N-terminal domain-containing protein [Polyangiaceae bacterium]